MKLKHKGPVILTEFCQCSSKACSTPFSLYPKLSSLGGVYMTPGRLSRRSEFTLVPSHGSTFAYMIPPQNDMLAWVTLAWVHLGCYTAARISLRYEISQQYHVNAKQPHVSVWNQSAGKTGTGSACVTFAILNHTCILSTWCLPSNNEIWHDPMNHHVNAIQNQKVIPVWNTRRCEFSHVNTPLYVIPFYCERFHDSTWCRLEKHLSSSNNPLRKRSGGSKIC